MTANDPGNQYAVPYMYGTVLIGFNPDKVKAVLGRRCARGQLGPDLQRRGTSANSSSAAWPCWTHRAEILPIALHYLGLDPNSTQPG